MTFAFRAVEFHQLASSRDAYLSPGVYQLDRQILAAFAFGVPSDLRFGIGKNWRAVHVSSLRMHA